jgi:hypothetical protein
MESSKIKAILLIFLSAIAAIYLGITAATAQIETLIWVFGGLTLVTCLTLGRRVYLILPITASIGLILPLPGNFSSGLIAQGLFIGFSVLLFLVRKLNAKIEISRLEICGLLMLASVLQAYMRNPVGLNVFGTVTVGAKPYIIVFVTMLTAAVISSLKIKPNDLKLWVKLSFLGSILNFSLGAVGMLIPQIGLYMGATFGANVAETQTSVDGRATRIGFLRGISYGLANWISSHRNPLTACFHPLIAPLILFTLAASTMSGYRSAAIYVGLIYLLGICYRAGFKSVIVSVVGSVMGLALLSLTNSITPLPINIQRSLTFLPGKWDPSLVQESQQSSEWRVEMWKEALLSERWIKNKILGDGLGFTRQELETMLDTDMHKMNATSRSGLTYQQESFMISGGYHSGPVQTIRTTGYVGLTILLASMICVATHAHRQIQRCRNTEWYPVALFIGIPLIVLPFFWTFVFGTFNEGLADVLIGGALVRLMERNLPLPAYSSRYKQLILQSKVSA